MMKNKFIEAIHNKTKIYLTFFSKEDSRSLTRLCAPMDFGPSRRAHNQSDRYHFWDYESDERNHVLSLLPNQVKGMKFTQEYFNPSEFIDWETKWFIERDWGKFS